MRRDDIGIGVGKRLTADMARYAGEDVRPWSLAFYRRLAREAYLHPGLVAVVVYRYGQWLQYEFRVPLLRQLLALHYLWCFHWVRTRLQIEIPRGAAIDGGLRIDHFGSIIVNSQVVAGKNLTLSHGVLLGQNDTGFPTLQDDIYLGVGARVIGGITLGTGMVVGASAVVTRSFPDYAVVAGVPAKLIRIRDGSLPREEEARLHQERKRTAVLPQEQPAEAMPAEATAVVSPLPLRDQSS